MLNSYTYSILNFVTNYILTPVETVYDSAIGYFTYLFRNQETEFIEVNIPKKIIILTFEHNGNSYKIKSNIFDNNLRQVYNKIKEDLNNNTFEYKQFLGASINDECDITNIINEYAGPFGDFYQRYGMKMTVKLIIPENYIKDFKTLELMDENGEMYYFFNINDTLNIGNNINWFQNLDPEEKKKYIKHCPYI